jgi:nucleotide-binding universal stress UspA family protein
MTTIVVGFDGSPAAERALRRAVALSGADGRVVVVSATVPMPASGVVEEPILDSPSGHERDALLQRAQTTLVGHGIEPTLVAADARPARR